MSGEPLSQATSALVDASNGARPLLVSLVADRRSWLRRLLRIKLGVFALVIVGIMTLTGLFAPLIATHDPLALVTFSSEAPSAEHWLGTDQLGRDQFSRLVYGARASMTVSVLTAAFAVVVGSVLGLLAAYLGGRVDFILMRSADAMFAMPGIILPLLLVGIMGGSILVVSFALGVASTPGMARLMRGQALSQMQRDYVLASEASGASTLRIIFRHVAPNSFAPIIVAGSLTMSSAVLAEAGLSFLGVGVTPPAPTWGTMLSTGLQAIRIAPWQVFAPGLAIFLLILSYNFLGDALRDVLDPRLRGSL